MKPKSRCNAKRQSGPRTQSGQPRHLAETVCDVPLPPATPLYTHTHVSPRLISPKDPCNKFPWEANPPKAGLTDPQSSKMKLSTRLPIARSALTRTGGKRAPLCPQTPLVHKSPSKAKTFQLESQKLLNRRLAAPRPTPKKGSSTTGPTGDGLGPVDRHLVQAARANRGRP